MTIVVYGSTMGNTENAAISIAEKIEADKVASVSEMDDIMLAQADTILLGSSTWGYGDLQDDWFYKLDTLKLADLTGKRVGFFGTGDQEGYSDTFVNAMGTLYETVKDSGCELIGKWPVDGYRFSSSTAVVGGFFVGLALDEDNQSDETEARIAQWTASLTD